MKIIFIFSCSGMFWDVPECSGMFRHVPECSVFRVLSTAKSMPSEIGFPTLTSNDKVNDQNK